MVARIVLLILLAGFVPCGVSCGGAASGGSGLSAGRGGAVTTASGEGTESSTAEIELVTDRTLIEERSCVAIGRVLTRGGGGTTTADLKEQVRALGGNVVFVTDYALKRRHVNYNVKGTAYYCYTAKK